jgi:hypothetical protein
MTEHSSPTNPPTNPPVFKIGRIKLLIIISVAFFPIFAAYIVFLYFPEWLPDMTTNQGTLIQPPIVLDGIEIEPGQRWTLLIPVDSSCDKTCQEVLFLSRQTHIALGKNTSRVQRVILIEGRLSADFEELLREEHSEAKIIDIAHNDTAARLKGLVPNGLHKLIVFVMDPNGNVMMYYRPEQGGKPMLRDLKHLLKTSNIG